MNIWVIAGLILTHVVAFGSGVILHSVLISKLENILTDVQTSINVALSKLPKV